MTTNSNFSNYLELTKPGVQALLFVSCISGMLIASNFNPPILTFLFGLTGISFLAASAAVVNHIYDASIDSKMSRTKSRPIVIGSVNKQSAKIFAVGLYVLGSIFLLTFANTLTWVMTTITFIFYAFIYTKYLKHMTSQNIVIGGVAGAMPPLLGWTAITNSLDPNAWLLVLIILVWTPPHFWALAIKRVSEYEKAEVPMLPVHKGVPFTKLHILLYTVLLMVASLLPFSTGLFGTTYLIAALILGVIFLYLSLRLYLEEGDTYAMPTFFYSLWYLSALFGFMLIDSFMLL
ncbi:MAG: heme o synthase [Gammaproteobacteria bacterium]